MSVIGDFADEQGVALPASYLTFQTIDPTVVVVTATGQLTAVAEGSTVLIASTVMGIQAATLLNVDDPEVDDPHGEAWPRRLSAGHGLDRQRDPAASVLSWTSRWTSPPALRALCILPATPTWRRSSADGLVTAVGLGVATVTVIADNQEEVIPVQVDGTGRAANDRADSGVVQGSGRRPAADRPRHPHRARQ